MNSRNVKIQYGIFSGKRTGKVFRQALRAAGYHIVKDTNQADIIIAHSAGCFWLPGASAGQKLMLINPPYWPGKSIRERARARRKSNFQFKNYGYPLHLWALRNLWGVYYGIRDLRRTIAIFKLARTYDLDKIIEGHTVLLIHNDEDDWLTPDLTSLTANHPKLQIAHVPGDHDDCMYHPDAYIDLLQSKLDT